MVSTNASCHATQTVAAYYTLPMTDRRTQKTRLALRDALLVLLVEKGWDALSVQDVCQRANVGRSTFYLHYQGKDALLTGTLNELRLSLSALSDGVKGEPAPLAFLPGLLAHMEENRQVFKAVIGRRSSQQVERQFRAMVTQLMASDLEIRSAGADSVASGLIAHSLAGALVDAMSWWADSSPAPSVEVIEAHIRRLALAADSAT